MKKLMIPLIALCLCPVGCGNSKTAEEAAQDGDIPALKRMAENGDAEAQYHLAEGYGDGWEGLEWDWKEAAKWYRKAAEQGFNIPDDTGLSTYDPAHWISVMYEEGGHGLKQDLVAAYAWSTIAATNNRDNTSSGFRLRKRLRELAEKMTPEQIAKGQELSSEMVKKQPKLIRKKD
jgi:TPR repeat protein